MKHFKGTQGTWIAKPNSAFYQVNNDCDYNNGSKSMSISVGLNLIDEEIEGLSLTEENEANAKLIAAAPELLKACIEAEKQHQEGHSALGWLLRTAIEKAL